MLMRLSPDVSKELERLQTECPGLIVSIGPEAAGIANVKIGIPGVFSGELPGFKPRSGRSRKVGFLASFRGTKAAFKTNIYSPMNNLFANFKKRPQVKLLAAFTKEFKASGILEQVAERNIKDFLSGKRDFKEYMWSSRKSSKRKQQEYQAAKRARRKK